MHFQSIDSSQLFESCSEAGKDEQKEWHLGCLWKDELGRQGRDGVTHSLERKCERKAQTLQWPMNLIIEHVPFS